MSQYIGILKINFLVVSYMFYSKFRSRFVQKHVGTTVICFPYAWLEMLKVDDDEFCEKWEVYEWEY